MGSENLTKSTQNKGVINLINRIIDAGRVGQPQNTNPLLEWTAEIVSVPTSERAGSEVTLRKRNVAQMHKHNRKEDTVAAIKIIRQESGLRSGNIFREDFSKAESSDLISQDVLFETTNFVLQAISEADSEKFQILENFGELPQIFMFGRRPRMYNYSGMLWNHKDNNWKDEFRYIYENYLRGVKCVENGVKILLQYDRSVRMGYIINASINQNSEIEQAVPFNFSMFVEQEKDLIDLELIDPRAVDNKENTDAFSLIRRQKEATTQAARKLQQVINRKIDLKSPPKDPVTKPAVSPKPKPGYNSFGTKISKLKPLENNELPEKWKRKYGKDPNMTWEERAKKRLETKRRNEARNAFKLGKQEVDRNLEKQQLLSAIR